jgi:hypothetical protein
MKHLILSGALSLLLACTETPTVNRPAPPPPPLPPAAGSTPADAQQQLEAQQLEQAEAKCATQGAHAVAQRADGVTTYGCVPRGENRANPSDTSKP